MSCETKTIGRLSVISLGVAAGCTWALGVLMLGLINTCYEWGMPFLTLLSSMYIGYEATVVGSLVGALWAFGDAFIGGVVFALIYNCSYKCCCACCGKFCKKKVSDASLENGSGINDTENLTNKMPD